MILTFLSLFAKRVRNRLLACFFEIRWITERFLQGRMITNGIERSTIQSDGDLVSILVRRLLSRLAGLALQELRPRMLGCYQIHGDPDAAESNQEAVSHSDGLSPEKLWQVEHKPQGERNATPAGQRTRPPHRNRHQDSTNCQQQESHNEHDGSWPKTDGIDQAQERRAVLPERFLAESTQAKHLGPIIRQDESHSDPGQDERHGCETPSGGMLERAGQAQQAQRDEDETHNCQQVCQNPGSGSERSSTLQGSFIGERSKQRVEHKQDSREGKRHSPQANTRRRDGCHRELLLFFCRRTFILVMSGKSLRT